MSEVRSDAARDARCGNALDPSKPTVVVSQSTGYSAPRTECEVLGTRNEAVSYNAMNRLAGFECARQASLVRSAAAPMLHYVMRALALLACLLAPWVHDVAAQARFTFDTTPGNLPKTVVPVRYMLALDLDPARDDFTGRADVVIDVRKPVPAVVLHARDLNASRTELRHPCPKPRKNSSSRVCIV